MSVALPRVRCVVRCSRGTYVRSLARDFGAQLGLPASLTSLTRTRIGPFTLADAFPSQHLVPGGEAPAGLALEDALAFLPGVVISERASRDLRFGMLPLRQDVVKVIGSPRHGALRVLDEQGTLLAVGTRDADHPRDPLRICDSLRLYVESGGNPAGARAGR
jgi:tRNA U55 pseudouridine synthase TruB